MTTFLRRSELGGADDYSVIYRHDDGRELYVGRIFKMMERESGLGSGG
jgi:hypothetical protein